MGCKEIRYFVLTIDVHFAFIRIAHHPMTSGKALYGYSLRITRCVLKHRDFRPDR